jgi:predicted dehydrogenase
LERGRLIQVGVGGWGLSWCGVTARARDWDVVGYVDTSPERLEEAAEVHGLDRSLFHTDLGEAINAAAADAVVAIVPPRAHLPVARQALQAGLHVLVEKPLAAALDEAQEMRDVAGAEDRILMVSQNYRYHRGAQTVMSLLADGFLGEVASMEVTFREPSSFPTREGIYAFGGRKGYTGYSLVEDMSVHHFDLMRAVTGAEPTRVYARSSNPVWSWCADDAIVGAVIEMSNGALVHYSANWLSHGPQTAYAADWIIECERGQIEWSADTIRVRPSIAGERLYHRGLVYRDGVQHAELVDMDVEDRDFTLREFRSCIVEGMAPTTSADDNMRTLALTLGVVESAKSGVAVDL